MGQESSTLSSFEGLQISRVQHASPAFEAGLIPYFDFIVGVDTVELDGDNYSFFYEYVRKSENKAIKLRVFNIRIRMEREVSLTPRDWSGDRRNGLMGFNVSWESAEKAIESTWHITHVTHNSPAHRAELMATRDYLLGMQLPADFATMTVFKDSSEFHTRLEEWRMVQEAIAVQKPGVKGNLLMLIFDSIANEVKEIIIETSSPDESLGIEVANGYLHVVPPTPGSLSLPRLTRCVVTKQQHNQNLMHQQQQQQHEQEQEQPKHGASTNLDISPESSFNISGGPVSNTAATATFSSSSTQQHQQQPNFDQDHIHKTQPNVLPTSAAPSHHHHHHQAPTTTNTMAPLPTFNNAFPAPPPVMNNNNNHNNNSIGQQAPPPQFPTRLPLPPAPNAGGGNNIHHVGGLPPFVAPNLPPPPKF